MKRIHIVSGGDIYMYQLAIALKKKGYEVSCSGIDHIESILEIFSKQDILIGELNRLPLSFSSNIDFVVPSLKVGAQDSEIKKAQEMGLLIISFPEFILRMSKDKTRVVLSDAKHPNRILSMILFTLRRHNMSCDYVGLNDIKGADQRIILSYDSRIILLERDEDATFMYEKRPTHHLYRPHILVLPNLEWKKSEIYPSFDSYVSLHKEMVSSIERDGKFIYDQNDLLLQELSESVREDVTAIPYLPHECEQVNGTSILKTRYGDFEIVLEDKDYLSDINAARLSCRQLGIKDKDFYESISEFNRIK